MFWLYLFIYLYSVLWGEIGVICVNAECVQVGSCSGSARHAKPGKKRWRFKKKTIKKGILSTSRALRASVTYAISFAARSTLWTWQTPVSLFSLLTRRSNQANQPWVTLWSGKERSHFMHRKKIELWQQKQPSTLPSSCSHLLTYSKLHLKG